LYKLLQNIFVKTLMTIDPNKVFQDKYPVFFKI
jgi:hypothetical protein